MLIPRITASFFRGKYKFQSLIFLCLALVFVLLTVSAWQQSSRAAQHLEQEGQKSPAVESRERRAGYRSLSGRHKLRVTDKQFAAELQRQGALLVADYDAFQILSVDEHLALAAQAIAQNRFVESSDEDNLILLNAATLDTTRPELQQKRGRRATSAEASLYLVQFAAAVKPEWYAALAETGVAVVSYIPNNAYLVYGDDRALARLRDWAAQSAYVQWDGDYEPGYKIDPAIYADQRSAVLPGGDKEELLAIQLVADGSGNQTTLQTIASLKVEPIRSQFAVLGYLNVIVKLPSASLERQLASRSDVVSVARYVEPTKQDERQGIIMAASLSGNVPGQGDYLGYLAAQGFTQSQFTASNFAVNITDSGVDNATTAPNHFALYTGGSTSNASRIIYNRLEGTPNGGSTLEGCDGHGNLNTHILAGFVPSGFPFNVSPHADASSFRYGLGIAPFVKVGSTVIFDPTRYTYPNLVNIEARAYNSNARISSNSWAASLNGGYNVDAQAYDALVRDAQPSGSILPQAGNQEMVIVFASGNQGPSSGSVGAPGSAKNVITVGAAENVQAIGGADACGLDDAAANSANDMAGFSGRGPTTDGRRKPDLVAPGTHVTGGVPQVASPGQNGQASACFTGGGICGGFSGVYFPGGQQFYTASSGTSHSTPAVAGAAALLRQRFLNAGQPAPSPAMTKAALMNTARYLNGANANDDLWSNAQGMGEVNLTSAFNLFSTQTVLRDQFQADLFTASGQTRVFAGTISDSSKPFRVTLAWTDAPGPTSGNAFVNNLNLEVTAGGQTFLGNVFSGASSAIGGTADTRNNVESVFIPAGISGSFVVKITAANIAGDGVPNFGGALDQDFALIISNATVAPQAVLSAGAATIAAESCAPGNGAVDPGETVTVNLALQNVGTASTANLVATLQPNGGIINPGAAQTYGVLSAGGAAVALPFTFTAGGTCGGTLTATLLLQDGATNLGTVNFNFTLGTAIVNTATFTNNALITIPNGAPTTTAGTAMPYPSAISVSGLSGAISKVTVRLFNVNHTFPDDIDMLLVSPTGQSTILMSDAGGNTDIINATITFDDTGTPIPDVLAITSGTYSPADYGGVPDSFPSPAPQGPYTNPPRLSVFNGAAANGTWSLYIVDDADEEVGNILNGWSLTITTSIPSCCSPAGCSAITVNPPSVNSGSVGTAYTQTFTQMGGALPVSYGISGTVPPGLTLNGDTLSGMPTQIGSFNFTITAVDNNGCIGSRNYTLSVSCSALTITPATLPNGVIGKAYSQPLSTNGVGAVTFNLIGSLPPGLSLSSSGLLSGTPTLPGTYNFTIQASDANVCTGSRAYALTINSLMFYSLPRPLRLLDTRSGQGNCDNISAPIAAGNSLMTLARTTCEGITIPPTAQAVVGNLTVINQTSQSGYLTIYPDGQPVPLAANMIYGPGGLLSNNFTVGLSEAGNFNIFGERTIHVVVDISGYYAPPGTGGLYYHPLPKPVRLLDTRPGEGNCDNVGTPITGGTSLTKLARITCEGLTIPAAAQAIVGNATVLNVSGEVGYLTIYPNGVPVPLAANMIYFPGQILSNAFTVNLSAAGEFNIFGERTIDMVVDVAGYYSNEASDANGPGLLFNPLPRPLRILDTRPGQGNCDSLSSPVPGGISITAQARLTCEGITIPATALTILGNITVINQTPDVGYLTLYPDGVPQPLAANMIYYPGQLLSNAFAVGVNSGTGQFRIFAERTLDAIVDASGYFTP
ncbi:MAG: S8 family serine peptidase [Acidobacteriota bacterium]